MIIMSYVHNFMYNPLVQQNFCHLWSNLFFLSLKKIIFLNFQTSLNTTNLSKFCHPLIEFRTPTQLVRWLNTILRFFEATSIAVENWYTYAQSSGVNSSNLSNSNAHPPAQVECTNWISVILFGRRWVPCGPEKTIRRKVYRLRCERQWMTKIGLPVCVCVWRGANGFGPFSPV